MTTNTNIYTKAAAAGYVDEDTNTVTAEMVGFYLDDAKWEVVDAVAMTITGDDARQRLIDHEGDIAAAADSFEDEAHEAAAYYEDCRQTAVSSWYASR